MKSYEGDGYVIEGYGLGIEGDGMAIEGWDLVDLNPVSI